MIRTAAQGQNPELITTRNGVELFHYIVKLTRGKLNKGKEILFPAKPAEMSAEEYAVTMLKYMGGDLASLAFQRFLFPQFLEFNKLSETPDGIDRDIYTNYSTLLEIVVKKLEDLREEREEIIKDMLEYTSRIQTLTPDDRTKLSQLMKKLQEVQKEIAEKRREVKKENETEEAEEATA